MDEEHSDEYMDDRNIVTIHSIHEQSECYTCKQYECNEYVRSALARSNTSNVYEAWNKQRTIIWSEACNAE
jgi:hypothetical protein